jgi:hypothetical protein
MPSQPLQCFVNSPGQVAPGVAFSQQIGVHNPSNSATATGVTLSMRISPAGYTPIYSCSPNCSVRTGQITASLGTLYPGETRYFSLGAYGPQLMGQQFNQQFTVRSNQRGEQTCGNASFMVGGGAYSPYYISPPSEGYPSIEPWD